MQPPVRNFGYIQSQVGICIKYVNVTHQIMLLFLGSAITGIGIWLAAWTTTLNLVSVILENRQIYVTAYALLIIAGVLLLICPLIGCCGSIQENNCLSLTYLIIVIFACLVLITTGALGFAWNQLVRDQFRTYLNKSITNYYGISQSDSRYKDLTDAVDKIQIQYSCCGAYGYFNSTTSWFLYRNASAWYQETTKGVGAPYVPSSCCSRGSDGNIQNLAVCQGSQTYVTNPNVAPIRSPPITAVNPYLNQQGCETLMTSDLTYYAIMLGGLGIGCAMFLIIGVFLTFSLIRIIEVERMQLRWTMNANNK